MVVATSRDPVGLVPSTATTWPGKSEYSLTWATSRGTVTLEHVSLVPCSSRDEALRRAEAPLVASQQMRPTVRNGVD